MKIRIGLLSLLVSLALNTLSCTQKTDYDLALTDLKLFDSKLKTVLENKTVFINADTIAFIADGTSTFTAEKVIDGKGRLLVPGFIDTHTHLLQNYKTSERERIDTIPAKDLAMVRDLYIYRYLNHGVTTTIDMGQPESFMEMTLDWQKNPLPQYPNMYICGGSIVSDADITQPQHHIEVMNAEDARQKVRDYASKGLKHMKLYRKLNKRDMAAMADEASKLGITINTHVDNNVVTIQEAMDFGIKNFEHFFTVIPSVLNYDIHWKKMNEQYSIEMSPSIDEFAAHMVFFFSYIRENPEFDTKLEALFDRMGQENATISTALNVLASSLKKTNKFTSFEHFPPRNGPDTEYTLAQQTQLEKAFEDMQYYMKIAHDKGVKLRIGTDSRYGGLAMIEELILLKDAGIAIEDVLQIATYNGYDAMKLTNNWGSIEVGKKADLILFEKNPLETAENLRSSKMVIKDGLVHTEKRSVAFDLQDETIANGLESGLSWYENNSQSYVAFKEPELRMVFKEHFAAGDIKVASMLHKLYKEQFPNGEIEFGSYITVNTTYNLLQKGKYKDAFEHFEMTKTYFPNEPKTTPLEVTIAVLKDGIPAAENRFETIKEDPNYIFQEGELNFAGYLLLNAENTEKAIALLEMNTKAFPKSWNAYDSLGEAYLKADNKPLAIANYKKSLELNPENTYGIEALKKLGVY